ncbi:MAG: HAD family hydrolase [Prevotella sp.]|nr:HAD family hydrolase [Prevotella sp.]
MEKTKEITSDNKLKKSSSNSVSSTQNAIKQSCCPPPKWGVRGGFSAFIFDLDGTLLNTLTDLSASVNHALRSFNMPEHTEEDVKQMVGNGIKRLVELAIPNGLANPQFDDVHKAFMNHYLVHSLDATKPYDGIMKMLDSLKSRGRKMAIVSNKRHEATERLCKHFFSDYISVAIGESDKIKRKPAPDTVIEAMSRLDADKDSTVYIGDSDVDILTANNAGIPCISVLWGFRDKDFLLRHGATTLINTPAELLDL